MQMFIPSVLSALEALLKGPTWLLRIVISKFFGRKKPPRPSIQPRTAISESDSPYEITHSQRQRSFERTHSQQQGSTHHSYPPPLRPAAEYGQSPSAHQSSSARQSPSAYRPPSTPSHQPSYTHQFPSAPQLPSQHTPYQSHQSSVRLPAQPTPPISPDVPPVKKPVRSDIPRRSRRPSRPKLLTRTPEDVVTPIEIDPHEDAYSLRLKARDERDRMKKCFKQRDKASADNNERLAEELSWRGDVHKDNMMRLNKEASTKIFDEHNQRPRSDVINLRRLLVSEAKLAFAKAVQEVQNRGESSLRVIVGRGKRSDNNIARIKPAIQKYGKRLGLRVEVDPLNVGRLVVSW
ncbi:uncharacterized protein F5147DRAFT_102039 [Suillus discolor]|uniref:Smr domain-containing protein n=1 Tax=Suillus discolor TaxID=1912936 RepID=A0A9P7FA88_9AGAM|nr:uncharacterized protein F5147DRAFT_102039 [Suillus discolor]KAG2111273.1 hypothetical protein F5147DRAFT_102039 [Suillus discolor]